MAITRNVINNFYCDLIAPPDQNILTNDGFVFLADWSEQQDWWQKFAFMHCLGAGWRNSHMGDPYLFALTLYRFLLSSSDIRHNSI